MQQELEAIKASGLNVIAISNDSTEVLKKFATKNDIQFLLLSDEKSRVLDLLKLRDKSGRPGTRHEGIAKPMTILVDQAGIVRAKIPGTVQNRHNAAQLIRAWRNVSDNK